MIYETRAEAEIEARRKGYTTLQVDGSYAVVSWDEYYRRIQEEAGALYAGGWRAEEGAEKELREVYGFDIDHAEAIYEALKEKGRNNE